MPSVLTQYYTCPFLPVEPSEGNNLLEKSHHTGQALVFDSGGCDSNVTHAWNFSVYQEFLTS
jgi:hypothetical protein